MANVLLGGDLIDLLKNHDYPAVLPNEIMKLAFALGYGIIVASIVNAPLILTGDKNAWPKQWGDLITEH